MAATAMRPPSFLLTQGTSRVVGPVDLDALVSYVEARGTVSAALEGRFKTQ